MHGPFGYTLSATIEVPRSRKNYGCLAFQGEGLPGELVIFQKLSLSLSLARSETCRNEIGERIEMSNGKDYRSTIKVFKIKCTNFVSAIETLRLSRITRKGYMVSTLSDVFLFFFFLRRDYFRETSCVFHKRRKHVVARNVFRRNVYEEDGTCARGMNRR